MRTPIVISLFVAIGCYAGDTSDITTKTFERTNKDGTLRYHVVVTYRGKDKVMMETFRPNAQGVLTITSRGYWAGGDLVMEENDEHKSGRLDTLAVYHSGTDDMEVFTRQSDGSIKPVSTQTLQAHKTQNTAIKAFWDKAFDSNMDEAKFPDLMRETRKKMQDAEHQKTDDQK